MDLVIEKDEKTFLETACKNEKKHIPLQRKQTKGVFMMNEKIQIDIYKGLPMVLEKVKSVALSAVIGKSNAWINNKINRYELNGKIIEFIESDMCQINRGLQLLGEEISQHMIQFVDDREEVIKQVKQLSTFVCMPYIYSTVMGKGRQWYNTRMLARVPGRKVCVFKEDDILAINMAAMQIANELRSIEFVLK